jgi:hypothetical protein
MIKPERKILKTHFGTTLQPIKPFPYKFKVNRNIEAIKDGSEKTEKIFLKGSFVQGGVFEEFNIQKKLQRKVVLVPCENGRYLLPLKDLTLVPKDTSIDINDDIKTDVEDVSEEIEIEKLSKEEVVPSNESFLDKKFGNFTGKELLIGALGVIILIKIMK